MERKRLQFRHHNEVFSSRKDVMQYFADIVDVEKKSSDEFGKTLYAEPMVAKYIDEDGTHAIFAIGINSGNTPYHIIDSKEIYDLINDNKNTIDSEIERSTEVDKFHSEELVRIETKVDGNVAIIKKVEESSANVRDEFVLINQKGETLGEPIKIYKDNSLVDSFVYYSGLANVREYVEGEPNVEPIVTNTHKWVGIPFDDKGIDESHEYLYLVYLNAEGFYQLVGINYEDFLMEAEFGDGLKVVEHIASIKIKNGEKYLSVSNDGLQTINIDKTIKSASDILDEKIDAEIERSSSADEYISALTASFSASVVTEFDLVNIAIEEETKRAMEAEKAEMERAMAAEKTEIDRAMAAEKAEMERATAVEAVLQAQITANKVNSKDLVVKTIEEGTNLTLQVDERTITKFASASTIYESGVSVLGSLLKVKQVTPTSNAVKSRFELQDGNGKIVGDPIEVMVESALISVKQGRVGDAIDPTTGSYITFGSGDTTMNFVYRLEDATYELAQVVVAEYFNDAHFGRGLNNQDGVVTLLEGDGNEFLVIGEDTIAVTGVTAAIRASEDNSKLYTDEKYNESISYTDNRYNEATGYTDSQISIVTSSIDELTNTMNNAIESVSDTLSSAINDVNNSLQTEITNRETADADILSQIDNLSQTTSNADQQLHLEIDNEASVRAERDNELTNMISQEISDRVLADTNLENSLKTAISEETANRIAEDTAIRSELVSSINDVKSAYTAADTVLRELIHEEFSGRTLADANIRQELSEAIFNVNSAFTTSDNIIKETLETEIANRKSADVEIRTEMANAISEITKSYTEADAKVLSDAKEYADTVGSNVIESIDTTKVRDVKYDKGNKKIYLEFADNTVSEGFDASSFLIDGMIKDVNFDSASNSIVFIWNTDGGEKTVTISLSDFIDQYVIAEESKSFLKISSDNKISAIVDGADSFANTLASTNFVKDFVKTNIDVLSANTENAIVALSTKHNDELNMLSANTYNAVNVLTNDVKVVNDKLVELSGATINHVNEIEKEIINVRNEVVLNQGTANSEVARLETVLNNFNDTLTSNIDRLSGDCSNAIVTLSGNVLSDIVTLSGNTDSRISAVSGYIVNYVDVLRSDIDKTVSKIEDTYKFDMVELSGSVNNVLTVFENTYKNDINSAITYVNNADVLLQKDIDAVSTKVDALIGDRETPGSIPYVVGQEVGKVLITNGIPITSTSVEDSDKIKSLLKEVIVGGNQSRYYVSANANDMFYTTEKGDVKLGDYITSLNDRIKVLEDTVSKLDTIIKDTIKSYVVGTDKEVKVIEETDVYTKVSKLRVGFADDAVFGEIE